MAIVRRDPEEVLDVLLPLFTPLAGLLMPIHASALIEVIGAGGGASATRRPRQRRCRRPRDAAAETDAPRTRSPRRKAASCCNRS
jgi:hypothetical protein